MRRLSQKLAFDFPTEVKPMEMGLSGISAPLLVTAIAVCPSSPPEALQFIPAKTRAERDHFNFVYKEHLN
jgi:hypothetical protein